MALYASIDDSVGTGFPARHDSFCIAVDVVEDTNRDNALVSHVLVRYLA